MKYYGNSKFKDDSFLTAVGTAAFISSSVSRFALGAIQDYLGFIKIYMMTLILQAFICFSIYSLTSNRIVYVIWIVLSFVCEAAHFVIFPAVCSALYGSK
jgi:hypothetical protein